MDRSNFHSVIAAITMVLISSDHIAVYITRQVEIYVQHDRLSDCSFICRKHEMNDEGLKQTWDRCIAERRDY